LRLEQVHLCCTCDLAVGHDTNISQPALLTLLREVVVQNWRGTAYPGWTVDSRGRRHPQSGLANGNWFASDQASIRVNEQNEACHAVMKMLFTKSRSTLPPSQRDNSSIMQKIPA
jgi:hypothetical protein